MRRSALLAVGAVAALTSGCSDLARLSETGRLDRQFDAYVRVVVALGVRDPDSLDFYAGPPQWIEQAQREYRTLPDIGRAAATLLDEVTTDDVRGGEGPSRARRRFLAGQLRAVSARIEILGGKRFGFDDEGRLLFGVDTGSRDRQAFEDVRRELNGLLPGDGSLGRRYAAFERRFEIPRDRVPAVFSRAVDGCRRATLDHLTLPAGESVSISYVRGTPWSAFSRYEGRGRSRTEVNLDFDLTVDRALDLACHETYPGHHLINLLTQPRVQLMFSPMSLRTEGAATFAPELAFPGAARLAFERELFALAGLDTDDVPQYLHVSRLVDRLQWLQVDVARRYLDGELEFARATSTLEEEALLPSAEATLKFFNEFRTYALTYTVGRDLVAGFVGAAAGTDDRWRAYVRWLTD